MDKKARAVFQELREGGGADADFDELEEDGDMEAIEILETAALANEASDSDKAKRQREVKERLQGVMSIRRGGAAVGRASLRLRCVISLLVPLCHCVPQKHACHFASPPFPVPRTSCSIICCTLHSLCVPHFPLCTYMPLLVPICPSSDVLASLRTYLSLFVPPFPPLSHTPPRCNSWFPPCSWLRPVASQIPKWEAVLAVFFGLLHLSRGARRL